MSKKESKMFELISAWESSGLDRRSFCEQHGLKLSKFSYWRSRYKQADAASPNQVRGKLSGGFKPIVPEKAASSSIELIYPNGVKIVLPVDVDLSAISSLLHLV